VLLVSFNAHTSVGDQLQIKRVLFHTQPWQLCQGKRRPTKGSLLLSPRRWRLALRCAAGRRVGDQECIIPRATMAIVPGEKAAHKRLTSSFPPQAALLFAAPHAAFAAAGWAASSSSTCTNAASSPSASPPPSPSPSLTRCCRRRQLLRRRQQHLRWLRGLLSWQWPV
jgi:hypothetical protein